MVLEYRDLLLSDEWLESCYYGGLAVSVMNAHEYDKERGYISNLDYRWAGYSPQLTTKH